MKPNKKANPTDVRKVETVSLPQEPLWQPTWAWHLKTLTGVYVVLIIAYFAISSFLGRVPAPYKLREIPKEITPWMK